LFALKRYYKNDGDNVTLHWGPDAQDIEDTIMVSCAACWYMVEWLAKRVENAEIMENVDHCRKEMERLTEAAKAADLLSALPL
jgi:hypothetical protein